MVISTSLPAGRQAQRGEICYVKRQELFDADRVSPFGFCFLSVRGLELSVIRGLPQGKHAD